MEIVERETGKRLEFVALSLTSAEASELRDGLNQALDEGDDFHFHVSSEDFSRDIEVRIVKRA